LVWNIPRSPGHKSQSWGLQANAGPAGGCAEMARNRSSLTKSKRLQRFGGD